MNKLLGSFLMVMAVIVAVVCIYDGTIPCRHSGGDCADITKDAKDFWTYLILIVAVLFGSGIFIYFKDPD